MKTCQIILLFLIAALPAAANSAISIQQLKDVVAATEAHGHTDKELARKVANFQLTERLSRDTLADLLKQTRGPQTKEALQILADQSTFLDPPASEIPDQPAPTQTEQDKALQKAGVYIESYVQKLPNFLCTLIVRRFDDGTSGKALQLHDTVIGDLNFDGGKESITIRTVNGVRSGGRLPQGLRTHDEVGGLLSALFSGDRPPAFVWSHWEELGGQRVAVFRYSMDKTHSHFTVSYCCRPGVVSANNLITMTTAATGELSIDMASGMVFRVTEQSVDIPSGFPIHHASIMVEYTVILVGKKPIICPVRSITITDMGVHDPTDFLSSFSLSANLHSINEMKFTGYHEFGTSSTIVASDVPQPSGSVSAPRSEAASPSDGPIPAETGTQQEQRQPPADKKEPRALPPVVQASVPVPPLSPPVVAKQDIPDSALEAGREGSTSFKVRVNVVTVRAVVRDSEGRFVGDLQKNDFELSDDSKVQTISGFSVEKPQATEQPASQTAVGRSAPDAGARVAEKSVSHTPVRFIAYLFDDLHLTIGELAVTRKAAQRALTDPPDPNTRVAISTTSGRVVLDFTDDRNKLAQTVGRIKAILTPVANLICPPELSYYLADQILNKVDSDALRLATMEEVDCGSKNPEIDAKVAARMSLNAHEGEVRAAISALRAAVRRLVLMPGQRTIILISPGFITTAVLQEMNDVIDDAARNGVVINSMDGRELYVPAAIDDIENPNSAAVDPHNHEELLLKPEYERRDQAEVSGVLGQLANGTGGTFFQNSNDLYAGFKQLAAPPEVFYLLGFTPQTLKADGAYHKLKVKIKDRKGLSIQARDGYYAPKTGADPVQQAKQEIENAVFSRDEIQDFPTVLRIQTPAAGTAKVVVTAHVDLRPVFFQELNGHSHSSVVATFTLFDGDGKYIHGQQNKISLDYTTQQLAAALSSGLNLKSEFDAKPGQYLVRFVLRSEDGRMSASSKEVQVP
jgi:VWFA-related protein